MKDNSPIGILQITYAVSELLKRFSTTSVNNFLDSDKEYGTLGGTSFAVSASSDSNGQLTYMACDGSLSTGWSCTGAAPAYFIIYNPIPIEVVSFDITNYPTSDSHGVYAPTSGVIYGSNDNVTYTTISTFTNSVTAAATKWNLAIPADNQNFYKYYKIYVSMGSCGSGYGISIGEIKINGYYIAQ